MFKQQLFFISLLIFSFSALSQNRYWVAAAPATWSGNNWSSTSGGAVDGIGPPVGLANARFDANGLGNCTVDLLDPNISGLVVSGYTGIIDLNGNTITTSGTVTLATGTINDTPGTDSLVVNSTGTTTVSGTVFGAILHFASSRISVSGSTFNARATFIKNGNGNDIGEGGNVFNSNVSIIHNAGNNLIFANVNSDDFNGTLNINNAGTGGIYMSHTAVGNTYDGNILVSNADDGVFFGNNGGSSTLSATYTISQNGSFAIGQLLLREFTQVGATAQSISLTGTAALVLDNSSFGGDVDFITSRITIQETTFSGTSTITKTGNGDNASYGGNTFVGNLTLNNSGTAYIRMGNTLADTYSSDVTVNNTGTDEIYIAYNSLGNSIGGNLIVNNSGTINNYVHLASTAVSDLSVTGTAVFNNSGSGTNNRIFIGENGDVTFNSSVELNNSFTSGNGYISLANNTNSSATITGNVTATNLNAGNDKAIYIGNIGSVDLNGNLTLTNNSTTTSNNIYVANNVLSSVNIDGTTTLLNSGSTTTHRIYVGNSGDVTLNDDLVITNNSTSTNSQIYLNHTSTSQNSYLGNISIENVGADGVYFGNSSGRASLANSKTISLSGGGFTTGQFILRNFTQIGATAQSLALSGTSQLFLDTTSWSGTVDFSSPRIVTTNSKYTLDATLAKTGATDDVSYGANRFGGNVTLNNSGSRYFLMGNTRPDTFDLNLTLNNSGSDDMYLAYRSMNNIINGNLEINNTGSGRGYVYVSSIDTSSLFVAGTANLNNTGPGTDLRIIFGDDGDITVNDNAIFTNTTTGGTGHIQVANDITSLVTINGNVTAANNTTGTTGRVYLANGGDLDISGDLTITNSGTSTTSEVYIGDDVDAFINVIGDLSILNDGTGTSVRVYLGNNGDVTIGGNTELMSTTTAGNSEFYSNRYSNSQVNFNGNITLECTSSDGIRFGESDGLATLAATKTITIGGGGYSSGLLLFEGFSQIGATAQALTTTGTTRMIFEESDWGGDVVFVAPRISFRESIFSGTAEITKTGVSDDDSYGGNTFGGNVILNNSGTNHLRFGSTAADSYAADVTMNNLGSDQMFLASGSVGNTIGGNLVINNTSSGTASHVYISSNTGATLSIAGNTTINNSPSGFDGRTYFGNNGSITLTGDLLATNSGTGTRSYLYFAESATSTVIIGGTSTINNNNSITNSNIFFANGGDITQGGTLTISNTSGSTDNNIYLADNTTSVVLLNDNVIIENTNAAGDNIRFGNAGGATTLATTKTIAIGAGGFVSGILELRNFTQIGPTSQSLVTTGTSQIFSYDSNWGDNISFTAPRINSRGTTYNGTVFYEKTGAGDDTFEGGNIYSSDVVIINSGSDHMRFGNSAADTFGGDVSITSNGSDNIEIAYNSMGNTIAGNLTAINNTTGNGIIYLATLTSSSLAISGNAVLNNFSSAPSSGIYFANSGDVVLSGDLTAINTPTGATGEIRVANNTSSEVVINGVSRFENNGSTTQNRLYLGNNGDIIFNDSVYIINNSGVANSQVYISNGVNSNAMFNEHIVLECTSASSDGIIFGNNGGTDTLAANKKVTIGPAGFSGGDLTFRNFVQLGATAQSLTTTGNSRLTIRDSDWGGDITFVSPQVFLQESQFRGVSNITKDGAVDNRNFGGNHFYANTILNNSGSGYFLLGNNEPDTFDIDLTLNNSGTRHMYLAYNSPNNLVQGNLIINNAGTGTNYIYLASTNNSDITINGNVEVANSGNGSTVNTYVGSSGDVTIDGNLTVSNTASGNSGTCYISDGTNSLVAIGGNVDILNSGAASTKRIYLGNSGDINIAGTTVLRNTSSATNNHIYCNHNVNSAVTYGDDIVVESTNVSSDGVFFGNSGGFGELANTKTISIGAGGFIAGSLLFRNFTQVGTTAQTIEPTGTAIFTNYDSNWGGDVVFTSPRIFTRGTTYSGTATLTKNGASDDASVGGNTFVQNTILNNAGTDYFLMGNGQADVFSANLTMNNTSSDHMYLAHNSVGNTIAGDFVVNHNSTGSSYIYLSTNTVSTLSIDGTTTLNNTSSGSDSRIYLGDGGDVTLNSDLDVNSNPTSTNSYLYFADNTSSEVIVNGNTIIDFDGATNLARGYIGNNGDVTFNGDLEIINRTGVNSSQFYLNSSANSLNNYNGNITIANPSASSDGIYFGAGGGASILAATNTISIGALGFAGQNLFFRNFDQIGATAQTLVTGGDAIFTLYDCEWGGDVNFSSRGITTRGTVYDGAAQLTKTGTTSSDSYGQNTFNGSTTIINNSAASRMRFSNNVDDDFNSDVTFVKTGGSLEPNRNGNSTFAGDITINSNSVITFSSGNGSAILDGIVAQSINSSNALVPIFRRLTLNNSVDEITLNTPILVNINVLFNNGNLITSDTELLTITDNAAATGANDDSYVYGPVEKIGNDVFTFPVGDSGLYRPIAISAPSSTASRFRARYFEQNTSPTYNHTLHGGTITNVSSREYWLLDRTNGTDNVDVTLSWNTNSGGVLDLAELRVARWDGSKWDDHGNGGTTGNTTVGTIVSSAPITSFSPFTLGSTSFAANPLPIELISFSAYKKDDVVELLWETATEINNDYFTIERTVDGKEFEVLETIEGAGNSTTKLAYKIIDPNPVVGIAYYRLKQTDYDGKFEYFDLIAVKFNENNSSSKFRMYPNPLSNTRNLSVNWEGFTEGNVTVSVIQLDGKVVQKQTILVQEKVSTNISIRNELPIGIYILQLTSSQGKRVQQKLIIE